MMPEELSIIMAPNGLGPYDVANEVRDRLRDTLSQMEILEAFSRIRGRIYFALGEDASTLNPQALHIQFFTVASLRKLIESAGLKILQRRNSDFVWFGSGRCVDRVTSMDGAIPRHLRGAISCG